MVRETGLEPARRLAYAPKAYVYTNFTTRGCKASISERLEKRKSIKIARRRFWYMAFSLQNLQVFIDKLITLRCISLSKSQAKVYVRKIILIKKTPIKLQKFKPRAS